MTQDLYVLSKNTKPFKEKLRVELKNTYICFFNLSYSKTHYLHCSYSTYNTTLNTYSTYNTIQNNPIQYLHYLPCETYITRIRLRCT